MITDNIFLASIIMFERSALGQQLYPNATTLRDIADYELAKLLKISLSK